MFDYLAEKMSVVFITGVRGGGISCPADSYVLHIR